MRLLTAALLLLPFAAEGREVLTTVVRGPDRLVTGAPAALSITAERSTSAAHRGPWPGAKLSLSIAGKGKSQVLYAGAADERGQAQARFTAPSWPEGEYSLVLAASARGRERVSRFAVQLVSNGKVLLQSDKPLYQPGQTIHLRALALRPQDMKPLGGAEVQFEVHDARDNRVFLETRTTSAFGIAAADFEVGPEAMLGAYRAKALVPAGGAPAAELELKVERYSLPKFKVSLEPDRTWYRFGDKLKVGLEARYFFGKPVAGAEVKVLLSSGKGERLGEALEQVTAKTDAEGRATVLLTVPPAASDEAERTLTVFAAVNDVTGHSEKASRTVVAARSGLRVELVGEARELVAGVDNRLWVLAARPDGSPLVGAEVELAAPGLSAPLRGKSDELGIAQLEYQPRGAPVRCADLVATVGKEGERVAANRCLPVAAQRRCAQPCTGGPLRLRSDRALYPAGAPIHLELYAPDVTGPAQVDVIKDGVMVDTAPLEVKNGKGKLTLAADERRFGTLLLQAHWPGTGNRSTDRLLVYVERPSALKVEVRAEGSQPFRPGEVARLRFKVADASSGEPARAALGLVMVDQALLALRPLRPAMARSYFNLADGVAKHAAELRLRPGALSLSGLVEKGAAGEAADRAMRVMLAGAAPPWAPGIERDGFVELEKADESRRERVSEALGRYRTGHQLGERLPGKRPRWAYRRDLVAQMVKDGALSARDAADPWGTPVSTAMVADELGDFESWAEDELSDRLTRIYAALAAEVRAGRLPAEPGGKKPLVRFSGDDLGRLFVEGKLPEALRVDPWGSPFTVLERGKVRWISGVRSRFVLTCAGPDGVAGTRDDRFPADASYSGVLAVMGSTGDAVGFGGLGRGGIGAYGSGAGGGGFGSISLGGRGSRNVSVNVGLASVAGAEGRRPARVRDAFPETLLWRPELVTDEQGEASLEVPLADSITTWALAAEAVAADGRLGAGGLEVRVFQDFFVDLDLPPVLTQHDEVSVPVAVYNYLKTAQRVTLTLDEPRGFQLLGERVQTIDLGPEEVGVRHFRVAAEEVGKRELTVRARGSAAEDAIRRSVEVFPDGLERVAAFQERLSQGEVRHLVVVPASAIRGTPRVRLKLYPGLSSHAVEGLDGMLRMPSGCFEQASSTTYPNALILDYLRKTRSATTEVEERARRYLAAGYQKLLSYEVRGGGFSWFGDAPANRVLTAYGLEEFVDMAKVYPVDPRVITRTRSWLLARQQQDGSWPSQPSPINEGATDRFEQDTVRTTAYVALALKKAGAPAEPLQRARRYVRARLRPDADAYTLALANELLSGGGDRGLSDRLWGARREEKNRAVSFASREPTLTYGRGRSGDVEATARAALSLLSSGRADRVEPAISYLLASKDSFGNWYSTQATIRSLQALLEYEAARGRKREGRVLVTVDGKDAGEVRVTGGPDLVQTLELPSAQAAGEHQVALRFEGTGELSYQLVSRFHEPRAKDSGELPAALSVRTVLDRLGRDETRVGDEVEATVVVKSAEAVAMPVVTAGVPPGFFVDDAALEQLVLGRHIERYEKGAREVTFYLSKLVPNKPLWLPIRLTARMPAKVQVPPAAVYEYYRPEHRAEGAPATLVVGL